MYADDTTIYYCSPSVNDINTSINADLEALRGWLEGNKLPLNGVKTQGMIIGSRCKLLSIDLSCSSKPDLKIGSKEITIVNNTKYLGLQVDDQLKWSTHLSSTIKSLEVSVCLSIQKDTYQRKASLCCIEVSLSPILGTAALFGDLAVHQPSISCKNFKIELLGLSQPL